MYVQHMSHQNMDSKLRGGDVLKDSDENETTI